MAKKIILVTGASSGIGKATATRLLDDGHTVYGAARRVDKMQDLVDRGGHSLALDVTDHDASRAAVSRVLEEQGRIDVLVNNAGYAVYGPVESVSADDARRQFEVNLFGLAELTKAVLPSMRDQRSGIVINVSSIGGKIYSPLGAWYHATKHALEGWSDCLRLELKPFGIDVVIIEPGAILTEFGGVMYQPMIERIEGGPYEEFGALIARANQSVYVRGDGSPPTVIADVISQAIHADRPKTRYARGRYAGMMLFLRRWLSDRFFDGFLMRTVKSMGAPKK